ACSERMPVGLLSWIIFLPTVTAILVLAVERGNDRAGRLVTFVGMLAKFGSTLVRGIGSSPGAGMQMVERFPWIESFGIEYHLGVDGISLWLGGGEGGVR